MAVSKASGMNTNGTDTSGTDARRRRFERAAPDHPLTAYKLGILRRIAELQPVSLRQLALLYGITERAMRDHGRDLFHHGVADRVPVGRDVLADIDVENSHTLLYGSASTVYALSRVGGKVLAEAGLMDRQAIRILPRYGPKNWLFLAHELQVRDARVWIERVGKAYPGHRGLQEWRMGQDAWIGALRPDARFLYDLPQRTLVCFLEADRGTERAPSKWEAKYRQYMALFTDETAMQAATGKKRGRVLVTVPNAARRDKVWEWLTNWAGENPWARDRFWIAERGVLDDTNLAACVWRVAGRTDLMPLVASEFL